MGKIKIKKGDTVLVIAGDDMGATGEVIAVLPKENKLVVKGCKLARKAIKPNDDNKKGGFVLKEMPIHVSNVRKS